jgi:putative transposase
VSFAPHEAISELVNALKTHTVRILRRDFERELAAFYTEAVLWSSSYCAISVGGAPLEVLKTFIEQQDRLL